MEQKLIIFPGSGRVKQNGTRSVATQYKGPAERGDGGGRVWTALTRAVSATMGSCELTYLSRQRIDIRRAVEQHERYQQCLMQLGVGVISLPAEPAMPDAVFVEDPVIVVDEVAVIARTGAESRRQEAESLARALAPFRPLRYIREPGTLEGGDVLRAGPDVFVGLSPRTNEAGISQLAAILKPFGYFVHPVPIRDCLHLKTACSQVGEHTLLVNRSWVDTASFAGWRFLDVAGDEPWAANALRIGDRVLFPASFPHTEAILRDCGMQVHTLDLSELQKAEGSVTCLSVIFQGEQPQYS
jgi:dimethylargininase